MWTDRKQGNSSSRRPSGPAGQQDLSSPAGSGFASAWGIIGETMTVKGHLKSREDLRIDGEMQGTLELPDCRLTIGSHARVGADAKVAEIEVLGTLDGDVEASKKITVRRGGRLIGDLKTPGIVIEDGAYFKGRIEIANTGGQAIGTTAGPEAAEREAGADRQISASAASTKSFG